MVRWTGLAPWEFEFPFPGSLASTFLLNRYRWWGGARTFEQVLHAPLPPEHPPPIVGVTCLPHLRPDLSQRHRRLACLLMPLPGCLWMKRQRGSDTPGETEPKGLGFATDYRTHTRAFRTNASPWEGVQNLAWDRDCLDRARHLLACSSAVGGLLAG